MNRIIDIDLLNKIAPRLLNRAPDSQAKKASNSQISARKKFQQAQKRKAEQLHKILMNQISMVILAGFAVGEKLTEATIESAKKVSSLARAAIRSAPQTNVTEEKIANSTYVAVEAPFKISDEFAAIIDAKIDYEESAIKDILNGDFIGPLPETEHNLSQDFQSGALGSKEDYKKQMKALRGIIECDIDKRNYLTESLFNQLAKENAEITLEGDRPTIVFRLTQPSFRFSPDRRATNELIPIHVPK